MAFSSVWITLASLIAVFDIKKAVDEDGTVIEPSHEYLSALLRYPILLPHSRIPFNFILVPPNPINALSLRGLKRPKCSFELP